MPKYGLLAALACALITPPVSAFAQSAAQSLEGMWSDPPATPEDMMCFFWCTDTALERLEALLDHHMHHLHVTNHRWNHTI